MRLHHVRIGMRVLSALLVVGLASSGAATAQPTFTVNSVLDIPGGGDLEDGVCETAAGDGICTLRAAVMEANRVPGGGASVVVPANRYVLTRPPVVETEEASGDLDVLVAMTIEGDGASATVVDANAIDAVFDVSGGPVFMRRLGVESSSPLDGNRCIRNSGDLTLSDAAVASGVARSGGLVFNSGTLRIERAVLKNGLGAIEGGGGVYNSEGASVEIVDSEFTQNRASLGGGIANFGTAVIDRTLFRANRSNTGVGGGAVYNVGSITILNSTLLENVANQSGGGLLNAGGIADLVHVTIADNIASQGGGGISMVSGEVNLRNSIVSGNRFQFGGDLGECFGPIASLDYNRIGARSTCALTGALEHVNTVDLLGSLLFEPAFTGGFAETISPQQFLTKVIPPASCVDTLGAQLEVDGRGLWRDPAVDCDIGAVASSNYDRPASPIDVELIRNGGAAGWETGIAAVDQSSVHPPFWELNSSDMTQALYGAFAGFPLRSDAPPGSGSYFFTGGPSGDSLALQRIDIGAAAAEIDAGGLEYRIAGAFGGFEAKEDSAQLLVSFQDLEDNVLLAVEIGGFTAADRGNETKLISDSATGPIPIGTRIVVATVAATRATNSGYNDGSADALSIIVPEPTTAFGGLGAIVALSLLARRSSQRS